MATYEIDHGFYLFPASDAHAYLLDRIQDSAPDYFEEEDLDMALAIENRTKKYHVKEDDDFAYPEDTIN